MIIHLYIGSAAAVTDEQSGSQSTSFSFVSRYHGKVGCHVIAGQARYGATCRYCTFIVFDRVKNAGRRRPGARELTGPSSPNMIFPNRDAMLAETRGVKSAGVEAGCHARARQVPFQCQ